MLEPKKALVNLYAGGNEKDNLQTNVDMGSVIGVCRYPNLKPRTAG